MALELTRIAEDFYRTEDDKYWLVGFKAQGKYRWYWRPVGDVRDVHWYDNKVLAMSELEARIASDKLRGR